MKQRDPTVAHILRCHILRCRREQCLEPFGGHDLVVLNVFQGLVAMLRCRQEQCLRLSVVTT